jgi:hypothetical protein
MYAKIRTQIITNLHEQNMQRLQTVALLGDNVKHHGVLRNEMKN